PDSSAVRLADGRVRLVPSGGERPVTVDADDPRVAQAVRHDQAWLARGTVPDGGVDPATGADPGFRDMSARALLDLRLLTRPNGASLASWYSKWRYTWPRDSAFAVAAFTVTGHQDRKSTRLNSSHVKISYAVFCLKKKKKKKKKHTHLKDN